MSDLDDPLFVQYMQSDIIAMAEESDALDASIVARTAFQHEKNINANETTANEETNKLLVERFDTPHFNYIVPEFSNTNVLTIKKPNNEYIMGVRGTRVSNISDLISDKQILFNEPKVNRVETIEQLYKDFRKQQPTAKLTLTGQSLGGYVANQIGDKYADPYTPIDKNLYITTFDLPLSPLSDSELVPTLVGVTQKLFGGLKQKLNKGATQYAKSLVLPQVMPKHKAYLTDTFDVISNLNKYINFDDEVKIIPQQQPMSDYTGSHNPANYEKYFRKQKQKSQMKQQKLQPRMIKVKKGNTTHYSVPNEHIIKRSAASDVYDNCIDNPSLEKCAKKINKAVGTPPHGGFGSTF